MKILMFGRGVISTQYGWAFEKAGHDVEFYVRPGKKALLGEEVTLNIYDARKKIRGVLVKEHWKTKLTESIGSDYDLIFISVQHYQFKDVVDFLAAKIGNATVLVFNNFWDEPKETIEKLPKKQVVCGFPLAGGGFDENGILNGTILGRINFGSITEVEKNRELKVIELFTTSGFNVKKLKDFRSYLFSHFVMNAALHSENLKTGKELSSAVETMKTSEFWRNVILNGQELLPLLRARGVNTKASAELKILSMPPWLLSILMKITLNFLPPMKQILMGHSNPVEIKSYCKDVLATAETLKMALPRLESTKISLQ